MLRFRKPEPTKLTLTRAMIEYPAVTAKMLPDQVGLIQAASLEGNRVKDIAAKVEDLQKQGAKQLVLDLRHSATGGPEAGEQLANLFLDKGLITYTEGQKVERHDVTADPANDRSHLPLAVIVDRGTADGAEIAAAALMDDKRAEVIGERTYGDASIRKPITMEDGSAVILSVAKYYSPSGKAIQDTGVTPTVPVQETEPVVVDDDGSPQTVEPPQQPAGEDMLLKKAIDVVTKGNHEVVSNEKGKGDSKPGPAALTPLNVPRPRATPTAVEFDVANLRIQMRRLRRNLRSDPEVCRRAAHCSRKMRGTRASAYVRAVFPVQRLGLVRDGLRQG